MRLSLCVFLLINASLCYGLDVQVRRANTDILDVKKNHCNGIANARFAKGRCRCTKGFGTFSVVNGKAGCYSKTALENIYGCEMAYSSSDNAVVMEKRRKVTLRKNTIPSGCTAGGITLAQQGYDGDTANTTVKIKRENVIEIGDTRSIKGRLIKIIFYCDTNYNAQGLLAKVSGDFTFESVNIPSQTFTTTTTPPPPPITTTTTTTTTTTEATTTTKRTKQTTTKKTTVKKPITRTPEVNPSHIFTNELIQPTATKSTDNSTLFCNSPKQNDGADNLGLIVGVVFGILLFILAVILIVFYLRKKSTFFKSKRSSIMNPAYSKSEKPGREAGRSTSDYDYVGTVIPSDDPPTQYDYASVHTGQQNKPLQPIYAETGSANANQSSNAPVYFETEPIYADTDGPMLDLSEQEMAPSSYKELLEFDQNETVYAALNS
ncbi:uncharacterized protein LOC130624122 [Hydractinia symbiolongicarpus]|uniref:uncharacterized protein LOC130624122 n=1 Tax=Hydractinia symbiolongicarpus TaxID=13093 RepID=UPI00254CFF7F|nr:uncharacterized protein LOC130624122 [Hydractinia symbiolongicarpus]